MNLEELDRVIDAIENPKFIVVSKWWAEFIKADKRKRGRLIRNRRKKTDIKLTELDADLCYLLESNKNK